MRRITLSFLIVFFVACSLIGVDALGTCGDGFCDLKTEGYEDCPEDCIKEENLGEADFLNEQIDVEKCYVGGKEVPCPRAEQSTILPKSLQKNYSDSIFIVPLITTIIALILLLILKIKIAGKTLKEYLWPIKYYILGSILIVISQYVIGLRYNLPFFLRITQALWVLMVVFSLVSLIKKDDGFNAQNAIILGILYSFIIHGLKVSIRYFFYDKPVWYLIDRFFYGSILVMATVMILGPLLIHLRKRGVSL